MSEHPTDAHFLFTFVFKQALRHRFVAGHSLVSTRYSGISEPDPKKISKKFRQIKLVLSRSHFFCRTLPIKQIGKWKLEYLDQFYA